MKPIAFYLLLLSGVLLQAQNARFVNNLKVHFSKGTTFVHHEPEETVPADTLSYQFCSPEVQIGKDTLYLSYIEMTKGPGTLVSVEKITQAIPISCIEEINTFNFTFGATDHFEPPLAYLGFWMKEEGCARTKTFGIDPKIWDTGHHSQDDFELLHTGSWHVARFPAILTPKTMRKLKKDLKTLQKQE